MTGEAKVLAYKLVTTGVLLVGFGLDVASLFWSMEEIGQMVSRPWERRSSACGSFRRSSSASFLSGMCTMRTCRAASSTR